MSRRIGSRTLHLLALAAIVTIWLIGCSSTRSRDASELGQSVTSTPKGSASPLVATSVSASVDKGSLLSSTVGQHTASIEADGVTRWFIYYVPSSYNSNSAVALVFAFHGGNGSMQNMLENRADLLALADRDGFIAVFPNGQNDTNNRGSSLWNAVWCCGYAHQANKSDVEFVQRMVQAIRGVFNVDPKRIHAIGFSNGGMLTYRLAAEIPDTLASVAVLGAAAGGKDTRTGLMTQTVPTKPVPLLIVHGAADRTAPIEGGESQQFEGLFYMSQVDSLAIYTSSYHCGPSPNSSVLQGRKGRVFINRYTGCDVDLTTMLMENVAHGWPDTAFAGIDGTLQVWEFLKSHPKP